MSLFFAQTSSPGQGAVPYTRETAPQRVGTTDLNPHHTLRRRRYEEAWRFYTGIQWGFAREDGTSTVTANYCRPIVNKKASWLVGNGWDTKVPKPFEQVTIPILKEVWVANNEDALALEMAICGGVTGDVFALVTWQAVTPLERRLDPEARGKIRIRYVSPGQVEPVWNPMDMDDLLFVRIITEVAGPSGMATRRFIEEIHPNKIVEYYEGEEPRERRNDLGEIPLVHIPNEKVPGEYSGLGDLDGIIDLQRELNEKMTDISDVVNYYGSPVTVITGASARNLERGPKALWSGLPEKARVETLEMGGDLPASSKYVDFVRQAMFDVANIPETSLGRTQTVADTHAAALEVAYQPLVEATRRKASNYSRGFERINYFILRYWQLANKKSLPLNMCKHCGGQILRVGRKDDDGNEYVEEKCYRVNPHNLELLRVEDIPVPVLVESSYGSEVKMVPWRKAKELYGKSHASFWDPMKSAPLKSTADHAKAEAKLAALSPPPPPPPPPAAPKAPKPAKAPLK